MLLRHTATPVKDVRLLGLAADTQDGYLRCACPSRYRRNPHDRPFRTSFCHRQRRLLGDRRRMAVSVACSFDWRSCITFIAGESEGQRIGSPRGSGPRLTLSDHNWVQLGKQVAWVAVGLSWVFVVTYAIMFVINLIPGCKFRASEEAEIVGMDVSAVLHDLSIIPFIST